MREWRMNLHSRSRAIYAPHIDAFASSLNLSTGLYTCFMLLVETLPAGAFLEYIRITSSGTILSQDCCALGFVQSLASYFYSGRFPVPPQSVLANKQLSKVYTITLPCLCSSDPSSSSAFSPQPSLLLTYVCKQPTISAHS
jgi:hypothetical protein